MEERIKELRKQIAQQRELNIKLFNSIPVASHEDPLNEKAEPVLVKWREGSARLKALLSELRELERTAPITNSYSNTFVNGFGEATKRVITNTGYQCKQRKLSKEVMNFIS